MWDETFLYVLVDVKDDVVITDSEFLWADDSVEVYLDGGNEKASSYDANDFQFIVGSDQSFVYGAKSAQADGLQYAAVSTSQGYTIEIAIPLQALEVSGQSGEIIGFDIGINDDDSQGARDAQLMWNGTERNWPKSIFIWRASSTSRQRDRTTGNAVVDVVWSMVERAAARTRARSQHPNYKALLGDPEWGQKYLQAYDEQTDYDFVALSGHNAIFPANHNVPGQFLSFENIELGNDKFHWNVLAPKQLPSRATSAQDIFDTAMASGAAIVQYNHPVNPSPGWGAEEILSLQT